MKIQHGKKTDILETKKMPSLSQITMNQVGLK